MAKINIPLFVAKDTAGGQRFYWQPGAKLKKAGWKAQSLGQDLGLAIEAAKKLNAQLDSWRHGGAPAKAVKTHVQKSSVAALIEAYKKDEAFTGLAASTRRTYTSALNLIENWAKAKKPGDIAASSITPERVKVLRDALMSAHETKSKLPEHNKCNPHTPMLRNSEMCSLCGAPIFRQHYRAHGTLRVARTLFAFGVKHQFVTSNAFENFDLETPPPRDQIWDPEDAAAFSAAAKRIGYPSLKFAIELGEYLGQREEDLLVLQQSQWREVHNLDEADYQALIAEDRRAGISDGKVMGVHIRQKKGSHGASKRWVGIPVAGEMRRRIEAAIAANAEREVPVTTILVDDVTGRPWRIPQFIRKFAEARSRAVAPTPEDLAAGVIPHPALEELQFRDLRRTCVVRLGELGLEDHLISAITGHKLESVKKILEIYMPRTTKMASRAVVARIGRRPLDEPAREKEA